MGQPPVPSTLEGPFALSCHHGFDRFALHVIFFRESMNA